MGKAIFASVFGVDFPVCNEDQKVRLEAAFDNAMQYEREHPDNGSDCSCDLLIDLFSENPSRTAVIIAAIALAQGLYNKKSGMALLLQTLQEIEMDLPRGNA